MTPALSRRAFVVGAAAAWSSARRAHASIPTIGLLTERSLSAVYLEALRQGLAERGWGEGRLRIESRSADGNLERLPGLAADLVGLSVSVIITGLGTPAALAAKASTAKVPIVFVTGGDPVAFGIVPNRAKPGGNVTGLGGGEAAYTKRLQLLRELTPTMKRVGFLRNLGNPIHPKILDATRPVAARLGLTLEELGVFEASELEGLFKTLVTRRIDALFVPGDAMFSTQRARLIGLAARARTPAVYGDRLFPEAGGLISFSVDLVDLCRRAGDHVDKILRGSRPGDLPVVEATKFEVVVNEGTARDLGLTISPTLRKEAEIR
jgi:ABC-type uncharacterized transport system substrate-binding protein